MEELIPKKAVLLVLQIMADMTEDEGKKEAILKSLDTVKFIEPVAYGSWTANAKPTIVSRTENLMAKALRDNGK